MKWWRRDRPIIVVGLLLCPLGTLLLVQERRSSDDRLFLLSLAWYLLAIVIAIAVLLAYLRGTVRADKRQARFQVTGKAFAVNSLLPIGALGLMLIFLTTNTLASTINSWREEGRTPFSVVHTVALVLMAVVVLLYIVAAWRGLRLELTPSGLTWRTRIFKRVIPWEALAPGGPQRPHVTANKLEMITQHPELVTQRGWPVGNGSKERPSVPLQFDVHPWFLADAIRWYAEHPEDRDAIGTQTEHDRLLAALSQAQRSALA